MKEVYIISTARTPIGSFGGVLSSLSAPQLGAVAIKAALKKLGHGQITEGVIKDGLWDVYNDFHMGNAAELTAKEMNITREMQDAYAIESYKRAAAALNSGVLKEEIAIVEIAQKSGEPLLI